MRWLSTLLLLLPLLATAATITVETDRDPVDQDEAFQLSYQATGTPDGEPDFTPLERDFDILGRSTSTSLILINGRTERIRRWNLTLMARRAGTLLIPPIRFGREQSPPKRIAIRPAGARADRAAEDVLLEVELQPKRPYPGAQATLSLRFLHAVPVASASVSDPEVSEGKARILALGRDLHYQRHHRGRSYEVTERRYAIFPRASGRLALRPVLLSARLAGRRTGRDPRLGPFFNPALAPRVVRRSAPLELEVRPIPPRMRGVPWLPASDLTLQEEWEGAGGSLQTGEPIKRRIQLLAAGTEPGLVPELRIEADGWKVYPDRSTLQSVTAGSNLVASRRQAFALIPTRPGTLTLPAVEVVWWNTVAGRREVATLPARTFRVTGPPLNAATGPEQTVGAAEEGPSPAAAGEEPRAMEGKWTLAPVFAALPVLLALMGLLAWHRWRRRRPAGGRARSLPASARGAMRRLHKACRAGDPQAARQALIEWGRARWPEPAPATLEAIARRLGPQAGREVRELQRVLYAGDDKGWEGLKLLEAVAQARERGGAATPPADALPPLYRL